MNSTANQHQSTIEFVSFIITMVLKAHIFGLWVRKNKYFPPLHIDSATLLWMCI